MTVDGQTVNAGTPGPERWRVRRTAADPLAPELWRRYSPSQPGGSSAPSGRPAQRTAPGVATAARRARAWARRRPRRCCHGPAPGDRRTRRPCRTPAPRRRARPRRRRRTSSTVRAAQNSAMRASISSRAAILPANDWRSSRPPARSAPSPGDQPTRPTPTPPPTGRRSIARSRGAPNRAGSTPAGSAGTRSPRRPTAGPMHWSSDSSRVTSTTWPTPE